MIWRKLLTMTKVELVGQVHSVILKILWKGSKVFFFFQIHVKKALAILRSNRAMKTEFILLLTFSLLLNASNFDNVAEYTLTAFSRGSSGCVPIWMLILKIYSACNVYYRFSVLAVISEHSLNEHSLIL